MQNFSIPHIKNVADDPVFSVDGDIAMNQRYHDNGFRIALTGVHLSDEDSNDVKIHGLEVYASNSTTNFSTDQKLGLEIKSKKMNFVIALYHVFLKSVEIMLLIFFQ